MHRIIGLLVGLVVLSYGQAAKADTIVHLVGGTDYTITSITGLDIGGVLYDVTVHPEGTPFSALPVATPITFSGFAAAAAAVEAITSSVAALGINIPFPGNVVIISGFTDHAVVPYATDGVFVEYAFNFLVGCCGNTSVYVPLFAHPTLPGGPSFNSKDLESGGSSCAPLCPGVPVDSAGPGGGQWVTFERSTVPVPVTIDIIPGKDPNIIKLFSHFVPVAILSTATFDATTVDPASVMLNGTSVRMRGNGATDSQIKDVDKDGDKDLIVKVFTEQMELTNETELELTGSTFGGTMIHGTDTIQIVP